jgi:uncharacterized membrane protein
MARTITALFLCALTSTVTGSETSHWIPFLGRFHFVLLHLPIGILTAIAIIEAGNLVQRSTAVNPGRGILAWSLGISTTATVVCGWLLAWNPDEYDAETLSWHRWGGVAIAVLAWALVAAHHWQRRRPSAHIVFRSVMLISLIGAGLVGHQGGTLTHGRGFLTRYAPTWLGGKAEPAIPAPHTDPSIISGGDPVPKSSPLPPSGKAAEPIDQSVTFANDIMPILEKRCIECHGSDKQKGKLRLDSAAGIQSGGENGPVVLAGDPDHSELLRLVALPPDDDDIMPPKGDPLTTTQIAMIRTWIADGADFGNTNQ